MDGGKDQTLGETKLRPERACFRGARGPEVTGGNHAAPQPKLGNPISLVALPAEASISSQLSLCTKPLRKELLRDRRLYSSKGSPRPHPGLRLTPFNRFIRRLQLSQAAAWRGVELGGSGLGRKGGADSAVSPGRLRHSAHTGQDSEHGKAQAGPEGPLQPGMGLGGLRPSGSRSSCMTPFPEPHAAGRPSVGPGAHGHFLQPPSWPQAAVAPLLQGLGPHVGASLSICSPLGTRSADGSRQG